MLNSIAIVKDVYIVERPRLQCIFCTISSLAYNVYWSISVDIGRSRPIAFFWVLTCVNEFPMTTEKPGFHMITTIATIAAQRSQRLRSLRAYGNIHSAIFAIVATVIAEIEKFLSLRSLRSTVATIAKIAECMFPYARKDRSDRCDHMETRLKIVENVHW